MNGEEKEMKLNIITILIRGIIFPLDCRADSLIMNAIAPYERNPPTNLTPNRIGCNFTI
jgi:hypothetical protein